MIFGMAQKKQEPTQEPMQKRRGAWARSPGQALVCPGMKSFEEAKAKVEADRVSEEKRFWMDCCIAMSRQRSDAEKHADRMLEAYRLRWRGKLGGEEHAHLDYETGDGAQNTERPL